MKKILLSLPFLAGLTANAQNAVVSPQFGGGDFENLKARWVSCSPVEEQPLASSASQDASYQLPVPLAYLGTVAKSDNAVCNLLFRHKAVNEGAYMLASADKAVTYKDLSSGFPAAWKWNLPGTDTPVVSTQDANVTYSTPGVFDFPTLQVTTSNGTSSYNPGLKMKVGGKAEITTIDCRSWGETYMLSALQYGDKGFLGGTNSLDLVGFGNLFMLGTDDVYLDGVNVYLLHKPTKFKENATLKLQVWMTDISTDGVSLAYTPVEGAFLKMKDIKADGEDGAWTPIEGGAVAQFKFDEPLSMYGKTTFFVSVEGFGDDPASEDFAMLLDMMGKPMDEVTASNLLSHNSFARLKGENDYLRPINSYGGGTGTFAICPLISFPGSLSAIRGVTTSDKVGLKVHFCDDSSIEVLSSVDGRVVVYDVLGQKISMGTIESGRGVISVPSADHGLFIVKGPNDKTAKIIR